MVWDSVLTTFEGLWNLNHEFNLKKQQKKPPDQVLIFACDLL